MDILLKFDSGIADFLLESKDIAGDESLYTAVVVSLFTDKRAEVDELPIEYKQGKFLDLRGFFGDILYNESIGSKLWTLKREKQLSRVLVLAKQYALESLQWLVNDGYVSAVEVEAANPKMGWLKLQVRLTLPSEYSFTESTLNQDWNFIFQLN